MKQHVFVLVLVVLLVVVVVVVLVLVGAAVNSNCLRPRCHELRADFDKGDAAISNLVVGYT